MDETCILPGGFFQNEVCFSEAKLHPPAGRVEEMLADGSGSRCLAAEVTTLLTHCIERIGPLTDITPSVVRSLLVGDRDYLVLKLRQITVGDTVEAILVCPNPQCGQKIDIDFRLSDIPVKQCRATSPFFTIDLSHGKAAGDKKEDNNYRIEFRLPNGGDQEDLAHLIVDSEDEAVNQFLARCIQQIDGSAEVDASQIEKLPVLARKKIERRMAELAPQVEMEMEAKCPECETTFSFLFNVSQFLIDELKTNLDQLYKEIHLLAFYYKWPEADILSMTRKKRRKYLELLGEHLEISNRGNT